LRVYCPEIYAEERKKNNRSELEDPPEESLEGNNID
jgi:hypothetical protein